MNTAAKILAAILVTIIIAGTYAWINRYQVHFPAAGGGVWIMDRWTGEICGMNGGKPICFDSQGKVKDSN